MGMHYTDSARGCCPGATAGPNDRVYPVYATLADELRTGTRVTTCVSPSRAARLVDSCYKLLRDHGLTAAADVPQMIGGRTDPSMQTIRVSW